MSIDNPQSHTTIPNISGTICIPTQRQSHGRLIDDMQQPWRLVTEPLGETALNTARLLLLGYVTNREQRPFDSFIGYLFTEIGVVPAESKDNTTTRTALLGTIAIRSHQLDDYLDSQTGRFDANRFADEIIEPFEQLYHNTESEIPLLSIIKDISLKAATLKYQAYAKKLERFVVLCAVKEAEIS